MSPGLGKPKLCQRLETSFQVSSLDCLSVWGGAASLSLTANTVGFFQTPYVKQLSVEYAICLHNGVNPQRHQCPRERLCVGFSPNSRAQAPEETLACSGEHYQPHGSGLRVGVGVLLVFSSLAEIYSLTITMPADQRQREVLSTAGCAVTQSTFLVG